QRAAARQRRRTWPGAFGRARGAASELSRYGLERARRRPDVRHRSADTRAAQFGDPPLLRRSHDRIALRHSLGALSPNAHRESRCYRRRAPALATRHRARALRSSLALVLVRSFRKRLDGFRRRAELLRHTTTEGVDELVHELGHLFDE